MGATCVPRIVVARCAVRCVECNKRLTPDDIGYGHDCEVYYNQSWYDDVLKPFFGEVRREEV
jgi:hypothetical protein